MGMLATIVIVLAYLPQAIHVYKTKDAGGLSSAFLGILIFSGILWITYAIMRNDVPLLITNSLNLAQVSFISYYKLKYK